MSDAATLAASLRTLAGLLTTPLDAYVSDCNDAADLLESQNGQITSDAIVIAHVRYALKHDMGFKSTYLNRQSLDKAMHDNGFMDA